MASPMLRRVKKIEAARERAAVIKHIQEESLAQLPLNGLYIALWIPSDPFMQHDFQWGYYLHTTSHGGIKYQARKLSSGYILEHGETGGIFKSNFLCVLVQIATVPQEQHALVHQIMLAHYGQLNQIPGITCRVWLVITLRTLIQRGIVHSANAKAVEQECFAFGNRYSPAAAKNVQPRPVVRSRFCL